MRTTLSRKFVAEGKKWRRVQRPIAWEPKPGDTLTGPFVGTAAQTGRHGPYRKFFVKDTAQEETYFVTGRVAEELFDGANVQQGQLVRLVFQGHKKLSNGYTRKEFELFVEA